MLRDSIGETTLCARAFWFTVSRVRGRGDASLKDSYWLLILVGNISRPWIANTCKESFESQPIFGCHVDKLYSIANLEIARDDNAPGAPQDTIEPEHKFQLGSYFHREHHLHVDTTHAEISSLEAKRRCGPRRV